MSASLTTYQKVIIEPYEMNHIENLRITKVPNEHSTLFLTGILAEDLEDSYVQEAVAEKTIKIKAKIGEETKDIFSGIIQTIEVSARSNIYYIRVEAVSHSNKLDVEWIRRSYQKLSMPYETLMQKAVEKYSGSVMDKITDGKTIDEFILQYDETAWQFVKRMVSRFNVPLVVEDILDEPKVYAGLPDKDEVGDLEDFAYNIKKEISQYRTTTENFKESAFEGDYIYYEIISEKIFEIANKVKFKERTLYVNEVLIEMSDGIFRNIYKLTDKKGFHKNIIKNEKIIGLSLEGKEIDVAKDDVKIFLDIDEPHPPEEFCWFKYSTPYTSNNGGGFYCMPEIGEKIRLYMPDWDDEHAYSTSCVRKQFEVGGERGIPDIKYWRTLAGKEIMFTPNGIKIRCLDDEIFINMIVEDGILVQSNKPINIIANEGAGINMYAEGKIVIAAEEEFDAFCNGSQINMKGGVTKVRGNSIHSN